MEGHSSVLARLYGKNNFAKSGKYIKNYIDLCHEAFVTTLVEND